MASPRSGSARLAAGRSAAMNRRNFPASLALSALAVLLLALATAAPAEEEKQIKLWDEETDGHAYQRLSDAVSVDWTGGTIRASGYGFVREADYKVEGIRIGHAISAAQVDAKRNLAEAVSGLRITSSTTVRDMVGKTDRMVGGVRAFVVGARVVSEKSYRKDDMYCCDIVMEAPLGSDGGFASHILHYIQPRDQRAVSRAGRRDAGRRHGERRDGLGGAAPAGEGFRL
jgi:hypothetical protein